MHLLAVKLLPLLVLLLGSSGGLALRRDDVFRRHLDKLKARKASLEALGVQPPVERHARVTIPQPIVPSSDEESDDDYDDGSDDEEGAERDYEEGEGEEEEEGEYEEYDGEEGEEEEDEVINAEAERAIVMKVHEDKLARAAVRKRFSLRAEREAITLARERVYEYLLVAVRLPDGARLEGRFSPHEDVDEVYRFVEEHLTDGLKAQRQQTPASDGDGEEEEEEEEEGAGASSPSEGEGSASGPSASSSSSAAPPVLPRYSFELFSARPRMRTLRVGRNETITEAGLVTPASLVHFRLLVDSDATVEEDGRRRPVPESSSATVESPLAAMTNDGGGGGGGSDGEAGSSSGGDASGGAMECRYLAPWALALASPRPPSSPTPKGRPLVGGGHHRSDGDGSADNAQ